MRCSVRIPSKPSLLYATNVKPSDLFSAGTVLLSVLVSPNLQRAYTENLEGLLNTWSRCMETLTYYGQMGDMFAKRCHKILQAALAPRSRLVYDQGKNYLYAQISQKKPANLLR